MKSTLVTIAGISAISYLIPDSLTELSTLINKDDKEKGDSVVLNAANQYFLQQNLINVRNKIADALAKKFETSPKLFVGKVEVVSTLDKEGVINGYASLDGKKKFKADETVTKESSKEFIDRIVKEKEMPEDKIKALVQKVASDNPFSASQKRVRGSVASKPVGGKWTKLAEKIIKAGNGEKAATRLSKALNQTVDISGPDAVKRLALALSDEAKRALAALSAEQGQDAGTDESALVVDGTK